MVTPVLPTPAIELHDPEAPRAAGPGLRFRDRVRQRAGDQDLLVVRVGREQFALPVEAVEELVEAPPYRPVPGGARGLLGVFTSGGRLLSLYDPAPLLGASLAGEPVALVMRAGARMLALAVDDADDVLAVDLRDVREAPRQGVADELVLGVIWRKPDLITVLDARAVGMACAGQDGGAP